MVVLIQAVTCYSQSLSPVSALRLTLKFLALFVTSKSILDKTHFIKHVFHFIKYVKSYASPSDFIL